MPVILSEAKNLLSLAPSEELPMPNIACHSDNCRLTTGN